MFPQLISQVHLILVITSMLCPISLGLPIGLPTCFCQDYYGTCRNSGEIWVDEEVWQYECRAGNTEFKGCVASTIEQTNLVPAGQNLTIGGFWHFCSPSNPKLLYFKKEPICEIRGTKLHVGETFKNEIFKSVCREWGNEVIGCLVQDRELGELELIVGQQIEAGCYTHSCTKESEIPWKIRYEARPKPGCVQPVSKEYSINQTSRLAIKRTVYPLHELADSFFKADKSFSAKYRYLS